MKKIMIAVAIVCAAVMTQAATVKWQSGTMSGVTTAGAVTGYLFELTASQYSTYSALDAAALSAKLYGDYKDSLGSAQANGQNVVKKGAASLDLAGTTDYTAPATAYAAILYIDTANSQVIGNVASAEISSAQNVSVGQLFNNIGGTGGATSWAPTSAVPEPTSGLLLLLGMAGLALKRKRA